MVARKLYSNDTVPHEILFLRYGILRRSMALVLCCTFEEPHLRSFFRLSDCIVAPLFIAGESTSTPTRVGIKRNLHVAKNG